MYSKIRSERASRQSSLVRYDYRQVYPILVTEIQYKRCSCGVTTSIMSISGLRTLERREERCENCQYPERFYHMYHRFSLLKIPFSHTIKFSPNVPGAVLRFNFNSNVIYKIQLGITIFY